MYLASKKHWFFSLLVALHKTTSRLRHTITNARI
jgi:hypothetical protein